MNITHTININMSAINDTKTNKSRSIFKIFMSYQK